MKNISLVLSILFFSLGLLAQTNEQLTADLLNQTCGVDTENALKTTMNAKKVQAVEPLLIKIYEEGPSKADIATFEKASKQRYDMIQKALKSGKNYGLSEGDLELARKQTWEDFYEKEKENYVQNRRSQALLALGRTGGEKGKKLLIKEAKNTKSPLHKSAKEALRTVEGKQ